MRLTVDDIKRQTKSETKLIKARKVQQENLIKKIYIAKTQSEYHVEARMETLSGKFYATLQFTLNAESDVDYYFCSCKRTKICEHLLAVLYQIHDLQPEKFPYSYERKEEEIAVQPAAQLPLLQQSPSPVKKEKQRTSAEKEAVPVKKGRLQMECSHPEQGGDGEGEYPPQRADEAVCDLQSYSAGEQGLLSGAAKP